MLLCEHPQLLVPLGFPLQRTIMGGVLLFVSWVPGQRCDHLEEQSGVSRLGQSHIPVYPCLPSIHFYRHTVRLGILPGCRGIFAYCISPAATSTLELNKDSRLYWKSLT